MMQMEHASDQALVSRHVDGSSDALGEVYLRFHPKLLRFCRRHCWDAAAAEDAVQETFVRAIRYFDSFDPAYPLWPWLKTIARNVIAQAAAAPPAGVSVAPPVHRDPMTCVDDRDELEKALAALNARQEHAIRLRYFSDLSPKESALRMGLSVAAFNQILFRARDRLRQEYVRLAETALGLVAVPGVMLRRLWRWTAERARLNRPGVLEGAQGALPAVVQITAGSVALVLMLGAGPNAARSETRTPAVVSLEASRGSAQPGGSHGEDQSRRDQRTVPGESSAAGSGASARGVDPTAGPADPGQNGGGHAEEPPPNTGTPAGGDGPGSVAGHDSGASGGVADETAGSAPNDPASGGGGGGVPPVLDEPPLDPPTQVDDPAPGPAPRCVPTCVAIGPIAEELPDPSEPAAGDPIHSGLPDPL